MLDQSFIAGRVAKYVFWKNMLAGIIKIPLPILLFASLHGFGIYAGVGFSMLIVTMLALLFFMPKVYPGYSPRLVWAYDLVRTILPYSLTNYISNMLSNAPTYIYPLMILNILGPEQNAFFYITWMMTMILTVIPGSMAQSLFAEGSHDGRTLVKNGKRALLTALTLTIPAVAVMWLLGGWLLHIFGQAYATNGINVMKYLLLAMFPYCVNGFFMTVNQVRKQIGWILVQTLILAMISLGGGYVFVIRYGLKGIGMAYALAQYVVTIIIIIPLWMALTKNIDIEVIEAKTITTP